MSDFVQQQAQICDFTTSDSWVILSEIEQSIKRKIESVGTPLKDWDINIYRGVLTGYNDAFIIPTEKRDEILANCVTPEERERTAELIRPILRGRDIKRYDYKWEELHLIATFPSRHYDIDDYPAVKSYLLSFGIERLEQTGIERVINGVKVKARKKTNNKWFEVQDSISYWEDFSKPKIIYNDIAQTLSFAFSNNGEFLNNTAYFFTGEEAVLNRLLKALNSKIIDWYYRTLSVQLGEKAVRMFSIYVLNIPIPQNGIDILDDITSDDAINSTLCHVFGLTDEEYLFIQSQ
jgi:hypothetical protein